MTEDQLVTQFLAAVSSQSDVLVAMSVAGLAGVYVTFIRPYRSSYRPSLFSLISVLLLFVVTLVCGYLTDSAITGYFYQMAHGKGGSEPGAALAWLIAEDFPTGFQYLAAVQIATGVIGILWLAVLWFRTYRHKVSDREYSTGGSRTNHEGE